MGVEGEAAERVLASRSFAGAGKETEGLKGNVRSRQTFYSLEM